MFCDGCRPTKEEEEDEEEEEEEGEEDEDEEEEEEEKKKKRRRIRWRNGYILQSIKNHETCAAHLNNRWNRTYFIKV